MSRTPRRPSTSWLASLFDTSQRGTRKQIRDDYVRLLDNWDTRFLTPQACGAVITATRWHPKAQGRRDSGAAWERGVYTSNRIAVRRAGPLQASANANKGPSRMIQLVDQRSESTHSRECTSLQLADRLFMRLDAQSIRYCHWKSNQSLPKALPVSGTWIC